MSLKIGINGFGRIGKLAFQAGVFDPETEFVAINHPSLTPEYAAYMLKYDTVHGRWDHEISWDENSITVNGKKTLVFNCERPEDRTKEEGREEVSFYRKNRITRK